MLPIQEHKATSKRKYIEQAQSQTPTKIQYAQSICSFAQTTIRNSVVQSQHPGTEERTPSDINQTKKQHLLETPTTSGGNTHYIKLTKKSMPNHKVNINERLKISPSTLSIKQIKNAFRSGNIEVKDVIPFRLALIANREDRESIRSLICHSKKVIAKSGKPNTQELLEEIKLSGLVTSKILQVPRTLPTHVLQIIESMDNGTLHLEKLADAKEIICQEASPNKYYHHANKMKALLLSKAKNDIECEQIKLTFKQLPPRQKKLTPKTIYSRYKQNINTQIKPSSISTEEIKRAFKTGNFSVKDVAQFRVTLISNGMNRDTIRSILHNAKETISKSTKHNKLSLLKAIEESGALTQSITTIPRASYDESSYSLSDMNSENLAIDLLPISKEVICKEAVPKKYKYHLRKMKSVLISKNEQMQIRACKTTKHSSIRTKSYYYKLLSKTLRKYTTQFKYIPKVRQYTPPTTIEFPVVETHPLEQPQPPLATSFEEAFTLPLSETEQLYPSSSIQQLTQYEESIEDDYIILTSATSQIDLAMFNALQDFI